LAGPLAPSGAVVCTAQIYVVENAVNVADVVGTPTDDSGTPLNNIAQPLDSDDAEVVFTPPPGRIGDTIFNDENGDGVYNPSDGDFPLPYVVVNLLEDSGTMVIATAMTDENGNYLFTDLPIDQTYIVTVDPATLPAEWLAEPSADPDGGADGVSMITLTADAPDNFDQDFGYTRALGTIGDQIWLDIDQDGNNILDGDDTPLADIAVYLLDESGVVIAFKLSVRICLTRNLHNPSRYRNIAAEHPRQSTV